ncbi:MAG: hypothetical protein R3D33_14150 [Hyphomicrobiaceae bacterium]
MRIVAGVLTATAIAMLATVMPAAPSAEAEEDGPANFLTDGEWATAKDCVVLRYLPAERWNLYLAPDYYDNAGWYGWEAACSFTSAAEVDATHHKATLSCEDPGTGEAETSELSFELVEDNQMRVSVGEQSDDDEYIFNCDKLLGTQ